MVIEIIHIGAVKKDSHIEKEKKEVKKIVTE